MRNSLTMRLNVYLGAVLALMACSCGRTMMEPSVVCTENDLSEYRVIVKSGFAQTKLTSVDNDGDGYAEWQNGDNIYVSLNRDDQYSFVLAYSSASRSFQISPVGYHSQAITTDRLTALYASSSDLEYSGGSLSGRVNGDVIYTDEGRCEVDNEARTITFTIHFKERPVSLIKIEEAGGECWIRNMKSAYTYLTSLGNLTWSTSSSTPSYVYKPMEDAVYCYGIAPLGGEIELVYKSGKKCFTRRVPSVAGLKAGEMTTIKGPDSSEASAWNGDDFYPTGHVYTYAQASVDKPYTLAILGDGFTADDLKKGDCTFYKKAEAAMDYMFDIEPYKTYRHLFNVYFIAAESEERGADISSIGQERDTFFNTGWTSGTSYSSVSNSGIPEFVRKYCPDVVSGITSLNNVRVMMLINESTYGAVCYTSPTSLNYCFVSLTGSRSLAWGNYDKNVCGQCFGDFRNIALHEYGGHCIGRLGDNYSSAAKDYAGNPAKITTQHILRDFAWNVSTKASPDEPWHAFTEELKSEGGYDLDTAAKHGLGVYQCESYQIYRPSFVSCMVDNRAYFDTWSRYLISENIHKMCGLRYNMTRFKTELPKTVQDPTWAIRRISISEDTPMECPPPAEPVFLD